LGTSEHIWKYDTVWEIYRLLCRQKSEQGVCLSVACGDTRGAIEACMTPEQVQKRYGVDQEIIFGDWIWK